MCGYTTVIAAAAATIASTALAPCFSSVKPMSAACECGAVNAIELIFCCRYFMSAVVGRRV